MVTPKDDEVVDFSKIKKGLSKIFSKNSNTDHGSTKQVEYDEEQPFDAHKHARKKRESENISWGAFFRLHGKWMIPLLFLLITITASVYLRTMPMRMPLADEWAASSVESYYKNQIANQVSQQYPNLPEQNRNTLVEREWQKYKLENEGVIKVQISQTAEQFRAQFHDDSGTLYILGIDPYHYYRMVSNVLTYGHQGTTIRDGQPLDEYFLYPEGRFSQLDFVAYVGAFLHRFLNFFATVPLMTSFFLIGTIFSALSVIPAFFIGRKVSGNNVGGFYAALLVAVTSFFVARTTGESSDTDVYTVFFPLLITWLFLEANDTVYSRRWRYILAAGAGIITSLFSLAWSGGWWYIFLFLVVAVIGHLVIHSGIQVYRKQFSVTNLVQPLSVLGVYMVVSGIFVTAMLSFREFWYGFLGPVGFLKIKEVAINSLWPNIRTTVAELNVPPFSTVVSELGGSIFLILAGLGIILSLKKRENGERDYTVAILLVIWLGSSLFATTRGVRFILQVIPALALGVGIGLGILWSYLVSKSHSILKINKIAAMVIIFVGFSLLFIQPAKAGYNQAFGSVPAMNDQWYNTLSKINIEGDKNAVINSWWDFGHWFKAIGNRPVTFDGAAQVGYGAYWMGRALLVSNEKQTVGILRMLNCGQNNAFETLNSYLNKTHVGVDVLNSIVTMSREDAKVVLQEFGLDSAQAEEVLQYTHCVPPTDYFITSEDMIGKAGVWGHFGSWDFRRAEMYEFSSRLSQDVSVARMVSGYNITDAVATQYYQEIQSTPADQWIARWPSYLSGISTCTNSNGMLLCPVDVPQGRVGLQINLTTFNITVGTNQGTAVSPAVMIYATREGIVEKRATGASFGFGVILLPTGEGSYGVILADPELATSVFTKLFFFEGHGLSCFSNFDRVRQFTGGKISTWVVDYECDAAQNKMFFLPIEKVDAAHILIAFNGRAEEEVLAIATEMRKNLTISNFGEYATTYSDDRGSAQNQGNLGEFGRGVMVKEFETAAFGLSSGQISEPIRTQFGYHLIYVKDKKAE